MLSPEQLVAVTRRLRAHANPDLPPEPRVIELLGRVAQEDDWPRIVRWLDDPDAGVRVAAATAWAQSDRPLRTLADHAADPALRPIVIEAATRRGDDLPTMLALARNKPDQEQAVQAWLRALVAMSGRAAPADVLALRDALIQQKESPAVCEQVLGAAISRWTPPATGPAPTTAPATQPASVPPGLVNLYLARAELRLAQGDATQGLNDLNWVKRLSESLDANQRERLRIGLFEAALGAGEWDRALALAPGVVAGAAPDSLVRDTVAQALLASAQRSLAAGQDKVASRLVTQARALAREPLPPAVESRLREIESRLSQPAPETAPASRPATQAALP
jgi:hypothetical protein